MTVFFALVDQLRRSEYGNLYHPEQMITGQEDAANNFARGMFATGRKVLAPLMDRVRRLADNCSSLQGFLVFHSLGGGTGSGLTTLFLNTLYEEYKKKSTLEVTIYPSPRVSFVIILNRFGIKINLAEDMT